MTGESNDNKSTEEETKGLETSSSTTTASTEEESDLEFLIRREVDSLQRSIKTAMFFAESDIAKSADRTGRVYDALKSGIRDIIRSFNSIIHS